jgi:multisubunit Na+/H+ antiporter MnhG subunit
MNTLGYIFIIIGALFYALGGLGMFRMPDWNYNTFIWGRFVESRLDD